MDASEFYMIVSDDDDEGHDQESDEYEFVDDDLEEDFELEITHECNAPCMPSRKDNKRPREEFDDDDVQIIRPPIRPAMVSKPAVASTRSYFTPHTSTLARQEQEQEQEDSRALGIQEMEKMPLVDLANEKVFGNRSFRPLQREVIEAAVKGEDVFLLMPTGGGKSLCYQLPAVISRGVTVVICPLLSLMQDQVQSLVMHKCGGIPSSFLSSQQTKAESVAVLRELNKPQPTIKLLYVTPEQIVKSQALTSVLTKLDKAGLFARVVVDESHCVSSWGHDFRPDYKLMGKTLQESFANVPVTAVTATATDKVAKDILKILGIQKARFFRSGFMRENLLFQVVDKQYGIDEVDGRPQPISSLVDFITDQGGGRRQIPGPPPPSGIVYVLSRDESQHVSGLLSKQGITSFHYHAGMTSKQRMEVQNRWREGKIQCVVATIAFGMGIDKANVRWVAHYTLSKSLEGYYQEAGRAGRDGLQSICRLFYAPKDISRLRNMIRMGAKKSRESSSDLLESMVEYCTEEKKCRHEILMRYFGDQSSLSHGNGCNGQCDNCALRLNLPGAVSRSKPKKAKDPNNRGGGGGQSEWGGPGGVASSSGRGGGGGPVPVQAGFVKASTLPLKPFKVSSSGGLEGCEGKKSEKGSSKTKGKGKEAATNQISSYFTKMTGGQKLQDQGWTSNTAIAQPRPSISFPPPPPQNPVTASNTAPAPALSGRAKLLKKASEVKGIQLKVAAQEQKKAVSFGRVMGSHSLAD